MVDSRRGPLWTPRQDAADAAQKLSIAHLLYAAMPTIKVNNYAGQNDKKHNTGNCGTHIGVSRLQLITKERSEKECAENIGGEIWSRESSLGCVNQFECVEISYKSQNRNDADGGQYQGKLNTPEDFPAPGPVDSGCLYQLFRDADQSREKKQHGYSDILPDR